MKKPTRVNNHIKSEDDTIEVVVKFVGVLRTVLKVPQTRIRLEKGTSLHNALISLAKLYGKPFEEEVIDLEFMRLQPFINVMINGQNAIRINGLETILNDGDEILIIPPVTGGVPLTEKNHEQEMISCERIL